MVSVVDFVGGLGYIGYLLCISKNTRVTYLTVQIDYKANKATIFRKSNYIARENTIALTTIGNTCRCQNSGLRAKKDKCSICLIIKSTDF